MTLSDLVDLALPRRCVGCGAGGAPLCRGCLVAAEPVRVDVDGLAVHAAGAYADALRAALLRFKERGRRDLAGPLSTMLDGALGACLVRCAGPVVLVPVPSSRRAAAERGGDHLARLARRVAARRGLRVARPLRLIRSVHDSAGLGAAARALNLDGAMRAAGPPADQPVAVLLDDVVTTGATIREAHRALAEAGWAVVGAAVVAATPRHATRRTRDTPGSSGAPRSRPIGSAQGRGLASE